MVYTGQFSAPRDLVFLLPLYALLIPFIIWNTIRRTRWLVKNAVETYELTLDELQITRIQRESPTMVILRNEVHRIAERTGQGIRIESSDSGKNILGSQRAGRIRRGKNSAAVDHAGVLPSVPRPLSVSSVPLW